MKKRKYNWHLIRSTKGSVITLILLMSGIIYLGNTHATLAARTSEASLASTLISQKDDRVEKLIRENEELRAKLDTSQKIVTPDSTKQIVRVYLVKIFGDKDAQIAERIFTCESNLNPTVENHNKNGTIDSGVAQINQVHAKQFEQVMGVPFLPYSHDISFNLKFAKWLYDQQGWEPWVCSKLV